LRNFMTWKINTTSEELLNYPTSVIYRGENTLPKKMRYLKLIRLIHIYIIYLKLIRSDPKLIGLSTPPKKTWETVDPWIILTPSTTLPSSSCIYDHQQHDRNSKKSTVITKICPWSTRLFEIHARYRPQTGG
jgi:hypothetical protein